MLDVTEFLESDETIVWVDRPIYKVFFLQIFLSISFFGIPSLLFTLFFNYLVIKNSAYMALIITLPLLIIWLIIFGFLYYGLFSGKLYPTYFFTSKSRGIILAEMGGYTSPLNPLVSIFSLKNVTEISITQSILGSLAGSKVKSINFKIGLSNQIPVSPKDTQPILNIGSVNLGFPVSNSELTTAAYTNGKFITYKDINNTDSVLNLIKESEHGKV